MSFNLVIWATALFSWVSTHLLELVQICQDLVSFNKLVHGLITLYTVMQC